MLIVPQLKTEEKFYKQLLQNLHAYLHLRPRTLNLSSSLTDEAPKLLTKANIFFVQKVSNPFGLQEDPVPRILPS